MRILFDFISIQGYLNGGAEHTKRIFKELLSYKDIIFEGLYDSSLNFIENEFNIYSKCISKWVDIKQISNIGDYIYKNNIDIFYIGIFQRYWNISLDKIDCKTIVFIHDVSDLEIYNNGLNFLSFTKPDSYISIIKKSLKFFLFLTGVQKSLYFNYYPYYERHSSFLLKENVKIMCASNYTKTSIKYNLPFLEHKRIDVRYSPLKVSSKIIVNSIIKKLVDSCTPYFLMLNTNRWAKNTNFAFDVMKRICSVYPQFKLVTTGTNVKHFENHIPLPFIKDGELEYALQNAYALIYPSISEGFGYPVLEAMKYGTIVLCSNVTSIPEVAGNAGIYFNPFYRTELFQVVKKIINSDVSVSKEKLLKQYAYISNIQNEHLNLLLDDILSND